MEKINLKNDIKLKKISFCFTRIQSSGIEYFITLEKTNVAIIKGTVHCQKF